VAELEFNHTPRRVAATFNRFADHSRRIHSRGDNGPPIFFRISAVHRFPGEIDDNISAVYQRCPIPEAFWRPRKFLSRHRHVFLRAGEHNDFIAQPGEFPRQSGAEKTAAASKYDFFVSWHFKKNVVQVSVTVSLFASTTPQVAQPERSGCWQAFANLFLGKAILGAISGGKWRIVGLAQTIPPKASELAPSKRGASS